MIRGIDLLRKRLNELIEAGEDFAEIQRFSQIIDEHILDYYIVGDDEEE